jgi:anti-sigma factor RsiW
MTISDDDLVLYADNRLSDERKAYLVEAAAHDADLAETLAALDASRLPYKTAFENKPLPPIPEKLRVDVQNLVKVAESDNVTRLESVRASSRGVSRFRSWPSYAAQAACLMVCVGVGYLVGVKQESAPAATYAELSSAPKLDGDVGSTLGESDEQRIWVERVVDYQTLYVENTVENIEPDLPAAQKKLQALARSTGMRTAVPDLSESGYRFKRAQELGYNGSTLVQLVYSKEGQVPLALCFMLAGETGDQDVRVGERYGLGTASWIEGNQRFIIVADESAESLNSLYDTTKSVFLEG